MITIAKKMLPLPPKEAKSTVSVLEGANHPRRPNTHCMEKKQPGYQQEQLNPARTDFQKWRVKELYQKSISYVEIKEFTPEHYQKAF